MTFAADVLAVTEILRIGNVTTEAGQAGHHGLFHDDDKIASSTTITMIPDIATPARIAITSTFLCSTATTNAGARGMPG